MIDIESDVFDTVATSLRQSVPGIFVSSEYTDIPARFPAVTIQENDNRVLNNMRTTKIENAVSVLYEANVYSNKASGKKQEAKSIANLIDALFEEMGFTRSFRNPIPNFKDSSIYRIVMRYQAVIGPNGDNKFLIYQNA